ncbi:peptidoglycan DD-metalloendopeptidase family protein [Aneurinibacillus sp. BA2021]|nr:peptidoglycan DD-metalloendopeptidase family protein [Aneurinibacillus sp. BA2021]
MVHTVVASHAAGGLAAHPWLLGLLLPPLLFLFGMGLVLFIILSATGTGEEEESVPFIWENAQISQLGAHEIPAEFLPIYQAAAQAYGVPWNVLAAIHRVETTFSSNLSISSAGAVGHMQHMPATWVGWKYPHRTRLGNITDGLDITDPKNIAAYGGYEVDADNDGKADPMNLKDAVFTTASYLAKNGASAGDVRGAVFAYNHSDAYVNKVLSYADLYVEGGFPVQTGSGQQAGKGPFVWLVPETAVISSTFGGRFHPIDHVYKQHKGTDIGGRRFSGTPIVAARDGVVVRSGNGGGYGNFVEIDHGGGVTTFYGHMKPGVIGRGKRVRAGQPIGRMGSTGKSTGDHLHFEVRIHGKAVDPLKYY